MSHRIGLADDAKDALFSMQRLQHYGYLILNCKDGSLELEEKAGPGTAYAKLAARLKAIGGCRFAVYDHPNSARMILINWIPETVDPNEQMANSAVANFVKLKLQNYTKQVSDIIRTEKQLDALIKD